LQEEKEKQTFEKPAFEKKESKKETWARNGDVKQVKKPSYKEKE